MEAFPEARTETTPRDREAPSGSARRRGEETGDRLTRSGVCGRPQECPHERPHSWSAVSLDYLETNRPEVSRSARPRRPTCRAPYLDSSRTEPLDTMDQVGRNRPAWMRLVPTRGGRRHPGCVPKGSAGWLRAAVQVCVSICGQLAERSGRVRMALNRWASGGLRMLDRPCSHPCGLVSALAGVSEPSVERCQSVSPSRQRTGTGKLGVGECRFGQPGFEQTSAPVDEPTPVVG